jgi:hypothetical protein
MGDSRRHAGHELQPHYKPAVSAAAAERGRSSREIERSVYSSDRTAGSAAQMAAERGRSLYSSDRTEAPSQVLSSNGTEASHQPSARAILQSSLVFRSPTAATDEAAGGLQGPAAPARGPQSPVDAPQDARKKKTVTQQHGDRSHGEWSATRDNVTNGTVNTHYPSTRVAPNLVRSANSDMASVKGTTSPTSPTSSIASSIKDQQRSFSTCSSL